MTVIFSLPNGAVKTTSDQQPEDTPAGSRKHNDLQLGTGCCLLPVIQTGAGICKLVTLLLVVPPGGDMGLLQPEPGVLAVG